MKYYNTRWFAAALAVIAVASPSFAQEGDDEEEEDNSIESFVEEFEAQEGLFTLYTDPEDGDLYMEIAESQLGQEVIYFTYAENGAPRVGLFRGQYRDNAVFEFNKRYGDIEISQVNTNFAFDADNALARAAEANITRAPLAELSIVAETEADEEAGTEARYLIEIGDVLKGEDLHQIKPAGPQGPAAAQAFNMGRLESDLTRIMETRSYPENTDILVEYVYHNGTPRNFGGPEITDARAVAVQVQHSFVAMPEDGFEPRGDDFRVGYFMEQVTNLTDPGYTPFNDLINRWRLEKQDPEADISDPVEPIVWWIENTTPEEYRDTIREAALTWNIAFEAAGFSNAIEVRQQPDDADWDAGDIRYNVLRWTSSPTPPFGGYGPSFTNPRTGEIIGADIMLEYVFLSNRIRFSDVFDVAGLTTWMPQEMITELTGEAAFPIEHEHGAMCNFAEHLQMETQGALAMMQVQGADLETQNELIRQSLHYLIIHEIGHTLGLAHNMGASANVSLEELATGETVTHSIMDYPALNLPAEMSGDDFQFSQEIPGAYDIWAIEYGYTADAGALPGILERSTEPENFFGNDADDMRAPGRHIDPRVMINDLSDDPVSWAQGRVDLVNTTLEALPDRMLREGQSYQPLVTSYLILTGQRFGAANVASRHIGGVYNNRSAVGQAGAETPFVPVSRETQQQALDVIEAALFGPDAFAVEEAFADHLQRQRRGWNHWGNDEDPSLHARAFAQQRAVLAHLTHPNVLERMIDTARYGNEYSLTEYMNDLTGIVYEADIRGNPNTYRQNLQVAYLQALIGVVGDNGSYPPAVRSAALASINQVKAWLGPDWLPDLGGSAEARAHRAHLRALIDAFEG